MGNSAPLPFPYRYLSKQLVALGKHWGIMVIYVVMVLQVPSAWGAEDMAAS